MIAFSRSVRDRFAWFRYFIDDSADDRCYRCAWYALTLRVPAGGYQPRRFACYQRCRARTSA